jgi:hypothetical protein
MELVAQGVANIASPIFGGIPATGAIARTATNVKNGGRTPVAGIVHVGNIDDALNVARAHLGLEAAPRPEFAVPTVAREDRRRQPRP